METPQEKIITNIQSFTKSLDGNRKITIYHCIIKHLMQNGIDTSDENIRKIFPESMGSFLRCSIMNAADDIRIKFINPENVPDLKF